MVSMLRETAQARSAILFGGAWGASYTVQRTYDLAGHVKSQNYPSGHTVNYTYDSLDEPAALPAIWAKACCVLTPNEFQ